MNERTVMLLEIARLIAGHNALDPADFYPDEPPPLDTSVIKIFADWADDNGEVAHANFIRYVLTLPCPHTCIRLRPNSPIMQRPLDEEAFAGFVSLLRRKEVGITHAMFQYGFLLHVTFDSVESYWKHSVDLFKTWPTIQHCCVHGKSPRRYRDNTYAWELRPEAEYVVRRSSIEVLDVARTPHYVLLSNRPRSMRVAAASQDEADLWRDWWHLQCARERAGFRVDQFPSDKHYDALFKSGHIRQMEHASG